MSTKMARSAFEKFDTKTEKADTAGITYRYFAVADSESAACLNTQPKDLDHPRTAVTVNR